MDGADHVAFRTAAVEPGMVEVALEPVRVQLRLIRSAVAPLGHLLDGVDTEETCASSLQQPGSLSSALGSKPGLPQVW